MYAGYHRVSGRIRLESTIAHDAKVDEFCYLRSFQDIKKCTEEGEEAMIHGGEPSILPEAVAFPEHISIETHLISLIDEARDLSEELTEAKDSIPPEEWEEVNSKFEMLNVLADHAFSLKDRLDEAVSASKEKVIPAESMRAECAELQQRLGIETRSDVLQEASLFIEAPLLELAALEGLAHPEELFGLKAWNSWLKARVASRGMTELSTESICELHSLLASGYKSARPGELRDSPMAGGSYSHTDHPEVFSDAEVAHISENPLLAFRATSVRENKGFIAYPSMEDSATRRQSLSLLSPEQRDAVEKSGSTKVLLEELLNKTIEWYKDEPDLAEPDPQSARAARLQRQIVSIHPFNDCNGRLSRLLMNWSLEKSGGYPAGIRNPDDDLLSSEEDWIEEVTNSSLNFYGTLMYSSDSDEPQEPSDTYLLLGFGASAFYDMLHESDNPAPSLERLDPGQIRNYMEAFKRIELEFFEATTCTEKVSLSGGLEYEINLRQGGLVSEEYVSTFYDTRPANFSTIRDRFFHEGAYVFRGVRAEDSSAKAPSDFLRLFEGPLAVGTNYRSLLESGTRSFSLSRTKRGHIDTAVEAYNMALASYFLASSDTITEDTHPELFARYKRFKEVELKIIKSFGDAGFSSGRMHSLMDAGFYLSALLAAHSEDSSDGLAMSPMVSATTSYGQGEAWASNSRYGTTLGANISVAVPREGVIIAEDMSSIPAIGNSTVPPADLPHEREVYLVGGINPNSIDGIDIFDDDARHLAYAYRTVDNKVVFVDFQSKTDFLYEFTPLGKLRLVAKRKTTHRLDKTVAEIISTRKPPEYTEEDEYNEDSLYPSSSDDAWSYFSSADDFEVPGYAFDNVSDEKLLGAHQEFNSD